MSTVNPYAQGQSPYSSPLHRNNYNPNGALSGDGGGQYRSYISNPYQSQGQYGSNTAVAQQAYGGLENYSNIPQGQDMSTNAGKAAGVAGGISTGLQAIQTGVEIANDFKSTSEFDVDSVVRQDVYNPRTAPPVYMANETPFELSEGTGGRAALNYAGKGAATGAGIGTLVGGPIGTAVGAGVGLVAGAVTGAFKGRAAKKNREEFESKEEDRRLNYTNALERYYDIQNQSRQQGARREQLNQRGRNLVPSYGASIYGIGNY